MIRINDPNVNCVQFVQQKTLYRYNIKCGCGEIWEWIVPTQHSARFIADLAAEQGWSLWCVNSMYDNLRPRCPKCLRKLKAGQRPKDPDDLGSNQRGLLSSLREHGSWHDPYIHITSGWLWDTPSKTKKILDTLVRRGLVHEEHGVYTPS